MKAITGSNPYGENEKDKMYHDPYTETWTKIYGNQNGTKEKKEPKSEETKKNPPTPKKPVTPDKGNDHRGTGEDNQQEAENLVREFEYDLEGTAEIKPLPSLRARSMIDFQGLGSNFSGKYFVSTVTHTINRSGYTMELEVLRSNFNWKADPLKKIDLTPNESGVKKKEVKKEPVKKQRYYVVKKGDTLWGISKRFYGEGNQYMTIVNANKDKIKDPNLIYPQQKFLIP